MQICSIDKFHDEIMGPLVFVDIVGPYDIAVIEPSRSLRFLFKAGEIGGFLHASFGQHLDCNASLHQHVIGQINATHSPRAEMP